MDRPLAVRVRNVEKTFHIPRRQMHTLKERALHPFRSTEHDVLRALDDVSFEVGDGEFFGIVGRNGSGKSTLLKCLAGIYAHDAGSIAVAGRLAPFIELGVGFNMSLTARDNVVINAVMMGLSPREARGRFDEIVAFAELEDFVDLELKNYSSGMQVRLAFAVMVQADADVMLIDEVLAVGDAAFQQKCLDEFRRLRDAGRTVVLVTHDMGMVGRFCHRALLLEGGRVREIGDPGDVGRHYLELNFDRRAEVAAAAEEPVEPAPAGATLAAIAVDDAVAHGTPIVVRLDVDVHRNVDDAHLTLWVDADDGRRVFGCSQELGSITGRRAPRGPPAGRQPPALGPLPHRLVARARARRRALRGLPGTRRGRRRLRRRHRRRHRGRRPRARGRAARRWRSSGDRRCARSTARRRSAAAGGASAASPGSSRSPSSASPTSARRSATCGRSCGR